MAPHTAQAMKKLAIDTNRGLATDAPEMANSGPPGKPVALAPLG